MNDSTEYIIELSSIGRSISDDDWKRIDEQHINNWKIAESLLKIHNIQYKNVKISIDIDWSPITRRCEKHYITMQAVYDAIGTPDVDKALNSFPQDEVKLPCNLIVDGNEIVEKNKLPGLESFIECFLYDVFLIMNLSAPGSCDFYSAVIHSKSNYFPVKISLSSFQFELAYLNVVDEKWPSPKILSLEKVFTWFLIVRTGVSQVPHNRMEKVLFALFHIAKLEMSPPIVIWLFYALETLFDTKVGENFRVMVDRIELLLSPDPKELKLLRRNLRLLYDLRSSFVHGGMEVSHPIHNEQLDEKLSKNYLRLSDSVEFGFSLLLTAVQKVIDNNWKEVKFVEVMDGEN